MSMWICSISALGVVGSCELASGLADTQIIPRAALVKHGENGSLSAAYIQTAIQTHSIVICNICSVVSWVLRGLISTCGGKSMSICHGLDYI